MKHDFEELITEAIMSETPVIVVEGRNDIQIYNYLVNQSEKNCWVEAVENIEGYTEGSGGVIDFITDVQGKLEEREENKKYILGIVDRDARYYRGEIPNLESLLILEYYSIESHFVSTNNLRKTICHLTDAHERLLDHRTISYIESKLHNNEFDNLYYIALDALKVACDEQYIGIVSYGLEAGNIFSKERGKDIIREIFKRKSQLEAFAEEHEITIGDLRKIAKGKWILYVYTNFLTHLIKELHIACDNDLINKCNFCKTKVLNKCLWKTKNNYQIGHVHGVVSSIVDGEFDYICNRIKLLA
ncbi:DUF4435 domain-containing protein [Paenibacillus sp. MER 99-2]|uniref:DUF4435 domain-containing protein n=1 Tax=Paenibacillus sp. MER 99-2 TaxID=2939572 RepID=UPI00203DB45D|nr:DUF4435 domain-containing protein [Paenibacillus sp. MER 99-2]MCM3170767.1 DUF4435 domain-containing protein [Paenibacillus sp. MER 99-2]